MSTSSEDLLPKPDQHNTTKGIDSKIIDSVHETSRIEPKSESDEIPEYLSDAANLISMAVQVSKNSY